MQPKGCRALVPHLAFILPRCSYNTSSSRPRPLRASALTLREHRASLITLEQGVEKADKCLFGDRESRSLYREVKAQTWTLMDTQTQVLLAPRGAAHRCPVHPAPAQPGLCAG